MIFSGFIPRNILIATRNEFFIAVLQPSAQNCFLLQTVALARFAFHGPKLFCPRLVVM